MTAQDPVSDLTDTIRLAVSQLRETADLLARIAGLPAQDPALRFDPTVHRLSPQEHRVALLIAQGRTNQQISKCLGISVNTVKNHNKRILSKLGLHSRTEVAVTVHQRDPADRRTDAG